MKGYLLDTWAWIDYLEGDKAADKVAEKLNGEKGCFTSVQSIAELSDLYQQNKIQIDMRWNGLKTFVSVKKTDSIEVTEKIAEKAGEIKAEERKEKPDFGLADAIILATARRHNLKLLSGDPHLADKKENVDLKN